MRHLALMVAMSAIAGSAMAAETPRQAMDARLEMMRVSYLCGDDFAYFQAKNQATRVSMSSYPSVDMRAEPTLFERKLEDGQADMTKPANCKRAIEDAFIAATGQPPR